MSKSPEYTDIGNVRVLDRRRPNFAPPSPVSPVYVCRRLTGEEGLSWARSIDQMLYPCANVQTGHLTRYLSQGLGPSIPYIDNHTTMALGEGYNETDTIPKRIEALAEALSLVVGHEELCLPSDESGMFATLDVHGNLRYEIKDEYFIDELGQTVSVFKEQNDGIEVYSSSRPHFKVAHMSSADQAFNQEQAGQPLQILTDNCPYNMTLGKMSIYLV